MTAVLVSRQSPTYRDTRSRRHGRAVTMHLLVRDCVSLARGAGKRRAFGATGRWSALEGRRGKRSDRACCCYPVRFYRNVWLRPQWTEDAGTGHGSTLSDALTYSSTSDLPLHLDVAVAGLISALPTLRVSLRTPAYCPCGEGQTQRRYCREAGIVGFVGVTDSDSVAAAIFAVVKGEPLAATARCTSLARFRTHTASHIEWRLSRVATRREDVYF
jgi:hypothetical protein